MVHVALGPVTTEAPVPVKVTKLLPPLLAMLTLALKVAADGGLKRTVIVWLCPAVRLNDALPTMLNGALVLALPVRVPPPVF